MAPGLLQSGPLEVNMLILVLKSHIMEVNGDLIKEHAEKSKLNMI